MTYSIIMENDQYLICLGDCILAIEEDLVSDDLVKNRQDIKNKLQSAVKILKCVYQDIYGSKFISNNEVN